MWSVWTCSPKMCSTSPPGEQLPDAELVLGPADEVLLARVADDVGVGVAEAHELERLVPQSFW